MNWKLWASLVPTTIEEGSYDRQYKGRDCGLPSGLQARRAQGTPALQTRGPESNQESALGYKRRPRPAVGLSEFSERVETATQKAEMRSISAVRHKTVKKVSTFLAASLTSLVVSPLAGAQPLRFATWNIQNFWHVPGESLRGPYRGQDTIRTVQDYEALHAQIAALGAEVWALQEIGSPAAARALFPAPDWHLVFSPRYDPEAPRDIYTAIALSTERIRVVDTGQIDLGINGRDRVGTTALIEVADQQIWIGSLHLKSGCAFDDVTASTRPACPVVAAQLARLESWIEAHEGQGFILGGDFNRIFMGRPYGENSLDPTWQSLNDSPTYPLALFPFSPTITCHAYRPKDMDTWPIDFIVASPPWGTQAQPGVHAINQDNPRLSDHCPVLVTFDLPPGVD